MIIERRAYTLKPGTADTFWQLQRDYNQADTIRDLIGHNICFFETLAGPAEYIVHLYRFDTLDQWDETYRAVYQNHTPEYFGVARPLILAQENTFLRPPPLPELQAGPAGFTTPVECESADPLVVETRIDFEPGTVDGYWHGLRELRDQQADRWWQRRIGTYATLVGPQHRVYDYQWYDSMQAYDDWHRKAPEAAAYADFIRSTPHVQSSATTFLRPAPVPSHRKLFPHGGA